MKIVCDFDGTITPYDVTDAVLAAFAPPIWEDIEQEWLSGRISAHQCMERQIALLDVPQSRLDAFLDDIPITPGFREFVGFCQSHALDMRIISDGLDYAIRRILSRHGLTVPVIANRLTMPSPSRYRLEFPYGAENCPSGVCKCRVAQADEPGTSIVLIGDSVSDFCLAGRAALVLAKRGKKLQEHCETHAFPYRLYDDFFDVREILSNPACPLPATPV
ncbi:2,3-diketo-5-methylthio-1-phosphopentane phosphatase [Betaproteobacteria bacterium]|nr:2,3-diketo-5-methylthio-1-phosphopentane phosphatase [Betaproteobacteria bacterium]